MSTKYKIPRSPGGASFTFSRGAFLTGKLPVQFGPGQVSYNSEYYTGSDIPPDAPLPTEFSPDDPAYLPPTDWPGLHTLLRPPQVVWLNVNYAVAPDQYGAPVAGNEGEYPATVALWEALYAAFRTFVNVQSSITAIRRGRTFVYINTGGVCAVDEDENSLFANLGGSAVTQLSLIPFIEPDFPCFVGSFLNIFAGPGHFAIDGVVGIVSESPNATYWEEIGGGGVSTDLVTALAASTKLGSSYQGALGSAPVDYPKFSKYGAIWYIPDLTTNVFGPAGGSATIDDGMANTGNYLFCKGVAEAMATDFGGYGFSWAGLSTLSEDGIVNQIADFFGFDPSTGDDLG